MNFIHPFFSYSQTPGLSNNWLNVNLHELSRHSRPLTLGVETFTDYGNVFTASVIRRIEGNMK